MPSWKKVILSGSDAALNSLNVTGGITGSDVKIDDWGSVSASLASLEASSSPTLQQVTDNGNITSNNIQAGAITGTSIIGFNSGASLTGAFRSVYGSNTILIESSGSGGVNPGYVTLELRSILEDSGSKSATITLTNDDDFTLTNNSGAEILITGSSANTRIVLSNGNNTGTGSLYIGNYETIQRKGTAQPQFFGSSSYATTASYAFNAVSASYAPLAATPTLQEVTSQGSTTTSSITINTPGIGPSLKITGSSLEALAVSGGLDVSSGAVIGGSIYGGGELHLGRGGVFSDIILSGSASELQFVNTSGSLYGKLWTNAAGMYLDSKAGYTSINSYKSSSFGSPNLIDLKLSGSTIMRISEKHDETTGDIINRFVHIYGNGVLSSPSPDNDEILFVSGGNITFNSDDVRIRPLSNNNPSGAVVTVDTGSGQLYYTTAQSGIQGAQGAQGPQGAQGAKGVQGAVGSQGAQGAQGAAGAQGIQGAVGAQGVQGAQGAKGVQGADGVQGAQGAQGAQGIQGAAGAQGSSFAGPQGAQGAQGAVGAQGVQGAVGAQGVQGAVGAQGVQGADGAQGAQGAVGAQGTQGAKGAQGIVGA